MGISRFWRAILATLRLVLRAQPGLKGYTGAPWPGVLISGMKPLYQRSDWSPGLYLIKLMGISVSGSFLLGLGVIGGLCLTTRKDQIHEQHLSLPVRISKCELIQVLL